MFCFKNNLTWSAISFPTLGINCAHKSKTRLRILSSVSQYIKPLSLSLFKLSTSTWFKICPRILAALNLTQAWGYASKAWQYWPILSSSPDNFFSPKHEQLLAIESVKFRICMRLWSFSLCFSSSDFPESSNLIFTKRPSVISLQRRRIFPLRMERTVSMRGLKFSHSTFTNRMHSWDANSKCMGWNTIRKPLI